MVRTPLLFVTPYFPDPEGAGPMRRAHAVLTSLLLLHDVTVLTITSSWHRPDAHAIPPGCAARRHLPHDRGLNGFWRWRRRLAERRPRLYHRLFDSPLDWGAPSPARLDIATRLAADTRFAVIHVFRLTMAPYALAIAAAQTPRPRLHLDIDDVESSTRARIAAVALANRDTVLHRREQINALAYARLERALLPRFDRLYVGSQHDTRLVAHAGREVRVLPNTTPVPSGPPAPPPAAGVHRFLFIGSLGYTPNDDAVRWFCEAIFPALRAARRCELVVAGRGANDGLKRFLAGREGVVFLGEVANSAPVFAGAHVVVVPLRAGGGTRIKILEAFAAGRPVVTTTLGIEGIDARPGEHHLAADNAGAFAAACLRLVDEPALRDSLASSALRFVSSRHSPAALDAVLA
jgi:glycosyltransferase involved in cell wall biosynthesis